MKALRIGVDFYINADDIEIIQPWPSRPAMRERKMAIEAGHYYDATGGKRILSVVTLRNGWVVATPLTPTRLIQRPVIAAAVRGSFKKTERDNGPLQESIEVLHPQMNGQSTPEFRVPTEGRADTSDDEPDGEVFSRENTSASTRAPLRDRLFRRSARPD